MTYAELVNQIKRMSRAEQQAILRELQRALKPAPEKAKRKPALNSLYGALRVSEAVEFQPGRFMPTKDSSLFRVLGALREKGKPAPTDEEVEQMIADYLIEKHA